MHNAILFEWKVREPEGTTRIDGISLHQTEFDASEFEKFWMEHHDIEGDFEILSVSTLMVTDDIWIQIEGSPATNKQYFRHEQLA